MKIRSASPPPVLDEALEPSLLRVAVPIVCALGAFLWAFWPNFQGLWSVWQRNPDYSAGQLVPFAAMYMIASSRERWRDLRLGLSALGCVFFAGGLVLSLAGCHYLYSSLANLGMVVCANALVVTLFGWRGYRRVWYPLAFLALMLPLPLRIHDTLMLPLQSLGARVSATILEIVGIPVDRLGHVLEVGGQRVAVAEACNGLRMVLAFVIVTGVVAYAIKRPGWQKIAVMISAVPIALACNVVRIVGTAYLYSAGYEWLAQGVFHDGAGLLMMPLAFAMVLIELWFLSNLVVPAMSDSPLPGRAEPATATIR